MLSRYGDDIGREVTEILTPALVLDFKAAERNIVKMSRALQSLGTHIRPHVKTHKSTDLARLQVDAGAIGLSTATLWEAIALAWEGFDDLFIVNTISQPRKIGLLAALARGRRILVATDDAGNAAALSEAAVAAGSRLHVLIEVDTGMDRAGVDTPREALDLARQIQPLPGIELEGLTGYEGHCALEPSGQLRSRKQQEAMALFLEAAELLESQGIPCPIRSAAGTVTWRATASLDGITEIQAGTYVLMDGMHSQMISDFEPALTVATSVISRPRGRLIVDAGSKAVADEGALTWPKIPILRFDEEHGIFVAADDLGVGLGAPLAMIPGYAPSTVNAYDAYHVAVDGVVVDIWPVFPRGPGHNGLTVAPDAP
ncbi:MAG TPA: alanine racemase [Streptosporangiaceae bacterium]|nr:alanine racemase [Streptosporangiaceae bacterium]